MKKLICILLTVLTTQLEAQIPKNAQSLHGYSTFGYSQTKDRVFFDTQNQTHTTQIGARLVPRYSRFLSDKVMIDVNPILGFQYKKSQEFVRDSNANIGSFEGKFRPFSEKTVELGFGLGVRYYILSDTKVKLFAAANYNFLNTNYDFTYPETNRNSSYNRFYSNWGLSLGSNYFLSQNIALEGVASFNSTVGDVGFLSEKMYAFNLNLRNFIGKSDTFSSLKKRQLTKENRGSIDGSIGYARISTSKRTVTEHQIRLSYAHFVMQGWLLGGTFTSRNRTLFGINESNEVFRVNPTDAFEAYSYPLTFSVFTHYYFPIVNRFFIHPQARFGIGRIDRRFFTNTTIGLGGSYFLTKDIAIEATLLEKTFNSNLGDPLFGGASLGIRYFVGK